MEEVEIVQALRGMRRGCPHENTLSLHVMPNGC